jgi:Domain of unknown function (DUF397)
MSSHPGPATPWQRSSFCANGSCVEVGYDGETILIRDSKRRAQSPLKFDVDEFSAFVAGIRNGEFDHFTLGATS